VGIPTGPEVAIMDDAGKLLAPGETGEIVIRGENVTAGYENNPKANESAFTNGWFRTGDQGYLDDDGYLFITGRIKEIINRGGEKISPREIDEVLIDHPAVAQAITFAMPHPTLGDDIAAAVVLKQGMDASELDIREFVAARVAHFKVPSKVVFVDEIPKGPTGKLQRIGLAERLGITAELQDKGIVEYVPPRTPVEESLAKMWAEVLGVKRVGINDHFFRLGGDSILATQLVARAREAFNVDLSLVGFFESPTVAGQALMITQLQAYGLSEDELSNLLDDLERGSDQPL
ncbi:MAG TPA: non-ribosomal peptide synthetase, partial [Armatimonadota bacterium]|nr:non-ribosomal peptide synthetase [Armatimonadota bacterium]